MIAKEEERACALLQSMFGVNASVIPEDGHDFFFGMPSNSVNVKVSLASGVVNLLVLKAKADSLASLYDTALMMAGMDSEYGQPIIWLSRISEEKQNHLREEKIPFFDDAGNAWLSNEHIHVDIRGRKISRGKNKTAHRTNIFSDKATIVMRILLESAPIGIHEISRVATGNGFALTPGYVSKTVSSLGTQGYCVKGSDGSVSLRRKQDMLKDWVYAYKKLSPVRTKSFFLLVSDQDDLVQKSAQATQGFATLSELAATSLIDPFSSFGSVLLLAKDFDAAAASLLMVGAREVDRGANIELVCPRYEVSAFWGEHMVKGCAVASDLQVYLDLSKQPRRGLEAAEHLYERRLKLIFDEGDDWA